MNQKWLIGKVFYNKVVQSKNRSVSKIFHVLAIYLIGVFKLRNISESFRNILLRNNL
jgi:hypothetical protein